MNLEQNIENIKNQLLGGMTADFLISQYNQCNDDDKVTYFKNIVNAANYVFTYNETYGTLNETTQKIGKLTFIQDNDVLKVRNKLSDFINRWMDDNSNFQFNQNMISNFVKNDKSFFFVLLSQNYFHEFENYNYFTNYLLTNDVCQQISPIEFFQQFRLSTDNNTLSYYHYLQTVEQYFYFKEIKDDDLYNLYLLSFKKNKETYFLHEQANNVLTTIIQEKFNTGKLNKKEFFQFLFDQNLKFSEKDRTLGMAIRDFSDEYIAQQFYKEIIEAIPDNFTAIKKDSTYGLFHALKYLATTKAIKSDSAIQVLHMLKIGSTKKSFMEFFEQNGLEDTVKKLNIFKTYYPNIYKSVFTSKNPIVVKSSDSKSLAAFELVMMHIELNKLLLKNNIKNRL